MSPNFMERFHEALSFHTAFFYCLEDCMDRCDQNRTMLEAAYLGLEIRNIVAEDEDDRIFRDMKIEAWKNILTNFWAGRRVELSSSSLYQADLVAKQFARRNTCMHLLQERKVPSRQLERDTNCFSFYLEVP